MSATTVTSRSDPHEDDEEDLDAILAELEAETAAADQEQLQQMKTDAEVGAKDIAGGTRAAFVTHDLCLRLKTDEETLRFTTEHEKAVVHFKHRDFARCSIMDEHINRIARRHGASEASGEDTAFAQVDVSDVPFVVEKLGVRVLPCVVGFARGIVKGRVTGFEGICWDNQERDTRVSKALEETLFSWGLLKQKVLRDEHDTDSDDDNRIEIHSKTSSRSRRSVRGPAVKPAADHDVDDDWD